MTEQHLLELIQTYIDKHMRMVKLERPLAQTRVTEVFQASIDIVDFIMFMEEELAMGEQINLEKLSLKFANQELTFADLATEIRRYLEGIAP